MDGPAQGETSGSDDCRICARHFVIKDYVYHIRLQEGKDEQRQNGFGRLNLLSRRCAWERGEQDYRNTPIGQRIHGVRNRSLIYIAQQEKGQSGNTAKLLSRI